MSMKNNACYPAATEVPALPTVSSEKLRGQTMQVRVRVLEEGKGVQSLGPSSRKGQTFFLQWFVLVNITMCLAGGHVSP